MTMLRILSGLLASTAAWQGTPSRSASGALPRDSTSCQPCHQKIFTTFSRTAHFKTSTPADARSIKGTFGEGHNRLRTRLDGVYFAMERRKDGFYQTGVDLARGITRTERIDLVVGSGRRGQTYLYWKNGLLFELPVSYLTGTEQWINSPGYADGQIDFGRLIVPRCLECHSTSFKLERGLGGVTYSPEYALGISCTTCHGPGDQHIKYHASRPRETSGKYILNPGRFSRDRSLDNCALCHSGGRQPRKPSFSYRPGEALANYLVSASDRAAIPDVHGDQVGLLRRSKCFRASKDMSCATCHDVHQPQRNLTTLAGNCLKCHQVSRHTRTAEIGGRMLGLCIDCHMPSTRSNALQLNNATTQTAVYFRNHAIGIYREVAETLLRSSKPR